MQSSLQLEMHLGSGSGGVQSLSGGTTFFRPRITSIFLRPSSCLGIKLLKCMSTLTPPLEHARGYTMKLGLDNAPDNSTSNQMIRWILTWSNPCATKTQNWQCQSWGSQTRHPMNYDAVVIVKVTRKGLKSALGVVIPPSDSKCSKKWLKSHPLATLESLYSYFSVTYPPESLLSHFSQEALKGDILKGDTWKWDFALRFALENGISLCRSHSTRQFSLLFLRKLHREGTI